MCLILAAVRERNGQELIIWGKLFLIEDSLNLCGKAYRAVAMGKCVFNKDTFSELVMCSSLCKSLLINVQVSRLRCKVVSFIMRKALPLLPTLS